METSKPKVLVIVGPTASGKTSLSIALAKQFNGEVISADSRQVYRGLDIGSGKVTEEEKQGVPHHLLDIADPAAVYTAADFRRDGQRAIADIVSRGKLPIIAGGTFFYVDTLLGRISTPEVPPDPALRAQLETQSEEALFAELLEKDPRRAGAIDRHNKVRLVRALEIVASLGAVPQTAQEELYETCTIGIDLPKETLHENIHRRLHERTTSGMIEEVEDLHANGVSWQRLEALGLEYRYISLYLQEKMSKEDMLEKLEIEIRHFAKRQMTWLARDKSIHWFAPDQREAIFAKVTDFLALN